MKYLKYFEQASAYEVYKNGSDYILPNVSYVVETDEVSYEPYVEPKETRLVCKYNVTSITSETTLCYDASKFSSMEIDGVMIDNVTTGFKFKTLGEHTVKFELTNPTTIGQHAFHDCSALTSVVIPDSVTSTGNGVFDGCSGLTLVVIPDSVTSIGSYAFNECTSLTGELVIPDSVTYIGICAFYKCYCLTSVKIGSGVTSIREDVFGYCKALTSVVIPDSVTSIDARAFAYCSGLTEITCNAPIAPAISIYTFFSIKFDGVLKVPAGSDYSTWMSTDPNYLGYYHWTIQYI